MIQSIFSLEITQISFEAHKVNFVFLGISQVGRSIKVCALDCRSILHL